MNRRAFLGALAGAAAATLDPERLLWVPGRKLISIPKPAFVYREFRIVKVVSSPTPLGFRYNIEWELEPVPLPPSFTPAVLRVGDRITIAGVYR